MLNRHYEIYYRKKSKIIASSNKLHNYTMVENNRDWKPFNKEGRKNHFLFSLNAERAIELFKEQYPRLEFKVFKIEK